MTSSRKRCASISSSDDDELPLSFRIPKKQRIGRSPPKASEKPSPRSRLKKRPVKEEPASSSRTSKRARSSPSTPVRSSSRRTIVKREKVEVKTEIEENGGENDGDASGDQGGYRWWDGDEGEEKDKIKWTTLKHNAVIFPPSYETHGIPMLYKGDPIKLDKESEEIATFYAAKLETDYVQKTTFRKNFFQDFRNSLKGNPAFQIVKKLEYCDFSKIHSHLEKKKQEKKEVPAAERKKLREEETERCKKYTVAIVDGRQEKVGNYRVEPPGLFLGRGEHPKMGRVKARIYPEAITINIGKDSDVPPCPLEGHRWGRVIHKQDVTWLCYWKDSITGGSKYVWLAAGSAFKGMSDHAKFEKARRLKKFIGKIRDDYQAGWKAKAKEVRQRSVAMYLIDKLALRVGNEKGEDEADTVGCCSLRVEHIKFVNPSTIELDFLGKDSIRYFNSVVVEQLVFDSLKRFCSGKEPHEEVFHRLSVTGLNDYLKSLMDGLSAKVFRTYNASFTLDKLLQDLPTGADLNEKIVFYNQQNKEVAILCNHQRSLPKSHGTQMEKMDKKVTETKAWLNELKRGRDDIKKSRKKLDHVELIQWMPEKPVFTEGMTDKQKSEERKRAQEAPRVETIRKKTLAQIESAIELTTERLGKQKADMRVKDDLKTVALGTSKINYLDPRITVAWCKKWEVPIEKIFAKTLLVKFAWAMETSEDFRF